jgi:hypothetical protein
MISLKAEMAAIGPREIPKRTDRAVNSANNSSPMVSVYDGQRCIGFVFARGKCGFEAFDADQRPLGSFASQREAAVAIMRVER